MLFCSTNKRCDINPYRRELKIKHRRQGRPKFVESLVTIGQKKNRSERLNRPKSNLISKPIELERKWSDRNDVIILVTSVAGNNF